MFPFNSDAIKSWEQLTIAGAALFILFVFIIVAFALLMRAITIFTSQQKDESKAKQELAKSLHELAESTNGYRVKLTEVEGKVDRIFTEQIEIKVDQRTITQLFRDFPPVLIKELTPEIKKAIAPYFLWLLKELMAELPTIKANAAESRVIDAMKEVT